MLISSVNQHRFKNVQNGLRIHHSFIHSFIWFSFSFRSFGDFVHALLANRRLLLCPVLERRFCANLAEGKLGKVAEGHASVKGTETGELVEEHEVEGKVEGQVEGGGNVAEEGEVGLKVGEGKKESGKEIRKEGRTKIL